MYISIGDMTIRFLSVMSRNWKGVKVAAIGTVSWSGGCSDGLPLEA